MQLCVALLCVVGGVKEKGHFLQVVVLEGGELGPKHLYHAVVAGAGARGFLDRVIFECDLAHHRHV